METEPSLRQGKWSFLKPLLIWLRQIRRPRQLKIGARLTLCFVTIVVLMIASHAFTLWQFDQVRRQEERIHNLDLESHAVLSVHASLLILRDKLDDLVTTEDSRRFAEESGALRRQFLEDVERADRALRTPSTLLARDPTMLSVLDTIESALPAQIDALNDLANLGDWPAVRLRMQNQLRPLSSLTSLLVEKVDVEVAAERSRTQQAIQRQEKRVFVMHAVAALFTLLVAGLLGTFVTRSITQPLAQLDAGAQALALGEFQQRVYVEGDDELATLGRVFNDATLRLSGLYGALKTSEERFRTVVAAAPVGIAVLDRTAAIEIFNPKFLEIVGVTAEQAARMRLTDPALEVLREDGTPCPITERPSQRAIVTGKPVLNVALRNFHPATGERRWVLTSAWPILGDDGMVRQAVVTLTDITEQKKVEAELRSGRELLDQAQRAAHMGSFDLDLQNNEVLWSPELADLFGLPAGTVRGRHQDWEALIVPEDLAQAQASVSETLRTGESVAEYRICRKNDREIRWVESRGRVFFDKTGEPLRLVGLTMDITARKRAEEALRRSEEEFHIIFEYSAIGMVLVDPSGHLIRCNPAFCTIVGYTESELPSLTFDGITHPDDLALTRSMYREVIKGDRDRYQIRKRYVRPNGEIRSGRVTVSALRSKNGELKYCVAMVEDITSQELAERTLLQMSERLLRIQEEEQRRIAREVHDSTSQEMTALTLNLGALIAARRTLPENAQKQVAESLALAKRVAREIRTFSYLLHPPMLSELGLWSAMQMFVEEFRDRSGLRVKVEISKELKGTALHPNQEIAIFRFVQEGLANVHRHSGSETAAVKARLNDRMIEVAVIDTGRGFRPSLLKDIQESSGFAGGVGISGMHERIGYIGGRLEFRSDENETTVAAIVPLDYQAPSYEQTLGPAAWRGPTTRLPLETPE
ncbi:MAG: PAS domain S-box protein [Candidatus Sulfotelmatobacter sp.]